jgi:hypothetical protein
MSTAIALSLIAIMISLSVVVYASRANIGKPADKPDRGDGGTSTMSAATSSNDCGPGDDGGCDGGGGGGD